MNNQEKLVLPLVQEANEDSPIIDEGQLESVIGAGGILDAVKSCFGCGSSGASHSGSLPPSSPTATPGQRADSWRVYFYHAEQVDRSPLGAVEGRAPTLEMTPQGRHIQDMGYGAVRSSTGQILDGHTFQPRRI